MTMPRKTGASRKPDMYAMLRLTDDGPVPTRRIAIHYTTSMPWAEQSHPMSRVTLDVTRIEPTYTPQEKN